MQMVLNTWASEWIVPLLAFIGNKLSGGSQFFLLANLYSPQKKDISRFFKSALI